jgi:PAS domain S-box-containing protein
MTEMRQSEGADGRHARWVAMWQQAIRSTRLAMGLIDLSTTRFIELSAGATELLGMTAEAGIGLSFLDIAETPGAAANSIQLARDGIIDGTQTRRRLRRPDGSTVEVRSTGWAIRSPAGPDLGLWFASEVRSSEHAAVADEVIAPSFPRQRRSEVDGDRLTLDSHWRVTHVRSTAQSLLGRPLEQLLGRSLIELTHPDDLAALIFALARATTDPDAQTLVRLRHRDGTWRVTHAAPDVLEGDGTTTVAFVLVADGADSAPSAPSGWNDVSRQLRRIADQIEAAGALAPLAEAADALGVASTANLSPRQWEIVSRLVRGERVATIAAEMYVSQSTIRNHLSAIFAKVGVHSQAELLALYHNEWRSGLLRPR